MGVCVSVCVCMCVCVCVCVCVITGPHTHTEGVFDAINQERDKSDSKEHAKYDKTGKGYQQSMTCPYVLLLLRLLSLLQPITDLS